MAVSRTIELTDIEPHELAEMFCDLLNDQQAEFFNAIAEIAKGWRGAGWCQQSCDIVRSRSLTDGGRSAIRSLAEHYELAQQDEAA